MPRGRGVVLLEVQRVRAAASLDADFKLLLSLSFSCLRRDLCVRDITLNMTKKARGDGETDGGIEMSAQKAGTGGI